MTATGDFVGRGLPDVAADASPHTGYRIRVDGSRQVAGGTSAVAPLWAGLIARMSQYLGGDGLIVRRLLGPDRAIGQRQFTSQAFVYDGYRSSDLAYAITGHSAQGATVHTGIALVTGNEDRQWLYPAMTRGTDANLAIVFTTPPRTADPEPRTRTRPPRPHLPAARRIPTFAA